MNDLEGYDFVATVTHVGQHRLTAECTKGSLDLTRLLEVYRGDVLVYQGDIAEDKSTGHRNGAPDENGLVGFWLQPIMSDNVVRLQLGDVVVQNATMIQVGTPEYSEWFKQKYGSV